MTVETDLLSILFAAVQTPYRLLTEYFGPTYMFPARTSRVRRFAGRRLPLSQDFFETSTKYVLRISGKKLQELIVLETLARMRSVPI